MKKKTEHSTKIISVTMSTNENPIFIVESESYCSTDGEHRSFVGWYSTREGALRGILKYTHNGERCDCNDAFKDDPIDDEEEKCFYLPLIITEICEGSQPTKVTTYSNIETVKEELQSVPPKSGDKQ